jgi:serine/threonine protein kinase
VARFQHEARVLASLNHTNIAMIHGLEEIAGRHFLIMELVPAETLAERIKRGAISIEEALPIAKQIGAALEEAHEKGIIHRDLKPPNIKVTPDGKVKVLDFGLAKAYEREPADVCASNSPTMMSMAATNGGVILGTAAYMSPEQEKGSRSINGLTSGCESGRSISHLTSFATASTWEESLSDLLTRFTWSRSHSRATINQMSCASNVSRQPGLPASDGCRRNFAGQYRVSAGKP